jgi:ATP-dependent exoDNAse (exonuclease V) beta subunit
MPVPEEDEEAVRVMTVHSAKGLEFPVVVLTGINSPSRYATGPVLFDRDARRIEVGLGSQENRIATPGYEKMAEREKLVQEAEEVRLMYVACTRARDHLVLSLRRTARGGKTAAAGKISEYLKDNPELWEPAPIELPEAPPAAGSPGIKASLDHSLEARAQWMEHRKKLLKEMGRPSFVAATSLGRKDTENQSDSEGSEKADRDPAEPWRKGRAGTLIGRALHVVLQSANLDTGSDIEVWARAQAIAEGIPDSEQEVAQLARRAVESETVRRAVGSGRYWREVPVAIPVGGGSLQGFIDLLFEEDGELVVVDYKTDDVREEAEDALDRYRIQGAAYALALQQATGKNVKEVVFLFPRPEPVIEVAMTNLAALIAEAEALSLARVGRG